MDNIKIKKGLDGTVIMGAINAEGMTALTDMASAQDFLYMEREGKVKISRLGDGTVYMVIADRGILELTYIEADEKIN